MPPQSRSVGVFTTDSKLVIRTWDEWLVRATNISEAAAHGRDLLRLFPEIVSRGLVDSLNRVLKTGAVEVLAPAFHHYLIACSPFVPSRVFDKMQQHVTIAPLREEEMIIGLIVTIEDVTSRIEEERQMEDALADEDWRKRKNAVEELAQRGSNEVVTRLLAALRDEHQNPSVLNSALQVLTMSGWDVVAGLAEFLRGSDADLRIYAALALGEQASPAAVPALIRALDDPEVNVKYHSIESLGKLRASEATDRLIEIVQLKDFFLSFPAIEALARIGDARCAPLLVELLDDEYLREPAAEALGKIGEIDALEPLCGLLNKGAAPITTVARSLAELYDSYEKGYREGRMVADFAAKAINDVGARSLIESLNTAPPDSLRAIALVIGWLEGPDVHRALTNLLSERTVRKEVFEALLRHGKKVSDLVIQQLESEDLETRRAAVNVLGNLGEVRAVPHLVRTLHEDEELTVPAAEALAKIGDRSAFESLIGLLGHGKAAVRQSAVAAINSLGHPDMALRSVDLLQDSDPRVRESAVRIAGYFAYHESIDLLLQRCNDSDETVQKAAIEHLPYIEDVRTISILLDKVRSGTPKVRAAAAQALGELKDERTPEALRAALHDPDAWVRYYAARAFAKQGAAEAVGALGELAYDDDSPFVRIAAIDALGLVGADAVKRLQPLAASEDRDIARAALEALGRTQAPDAIAPLLDAAHASDKSRRIDAAVAFAKFGGIQSVKVLQWLGADSDVRVATSAITQLASMGTPESVGALVALTAESERRELAMSALSRLGEKHAPFIARGLNHSQQQVRASIVEVLGRMKSPGASEWLARALDDPEAAVRLAAVNSLLRSGSLGHRTKLIKMAHGDPDLKVRQAARRVMEPSH